VEYNQQSAITWNKDITQLSNSGTSRASQVNTGIVTTYPYGISSELIISGTHTQNFALDLEDSGAAVWYTLAGCEGKKDRSSLFAASPYDGMDSYFLYSYQVGKGTVNYCGAGHTVVTGPNKDNNDERMLYMNVIVNAVRNKGSKPKITIHEKDSERTLEAGNVNTNPYLTEDGEYVYTATSDTDTPTFDYRVKVNSQTSLAELYVFYDLNYGTVGGNYSNKYTADDDHVLVYHYTASGTAYTKANEAGYLFPASDAKMETVEETVLDDSGVQQTVTTQIPNPIIGKLRSNLYTKEANGKQVDLLQLDPSYFEPYTSYTYLVIWAKDTNGKVAYQRIKIQITPELFDLTENLTQPVGQISTAVEDAIVDQKEKL
jgi:hypothetical protein